VQEKEYTLELQGTNTTIVAEAKRAIVAAFGQRMPSAVIVLGSGFEGILPGFKVQKELAYESIPGFPKPQVRGHSGKLLLATLQDWPCFVCCGRAHYYEGLEMNTLTLAMRAFAACGIREAILTNAAGAINKAFRPGEFMIFRDHINLIGCNPLRGLGLGEKAFVDLTTAYSAQLRRELLVSAARVRLRLHVGVYLGVSGPSYETPAEIKAFRILGADAVGMSTIPEVLMARACGMEVAALSCLTNMAAGMHRKRLSHEEVLRAGQRNSQAALQLLSDFAQQRVRKQGIRSSSARRKNLKNKKRSVGSAS
jgi:purine-nucleoside phosphorylase